METYGQFTFLGKLDFGIPKYLPYETLIQGVSKKGNPNSNLICQENYENVG